MSDTSNIQNRIRDVQKRIADAARRAGRQPDEVTLLAVSKTQPMEAVRAAYESGLREMGENRVQEALEKMGRLPLDIHWHLIGQLQTNKINKVLGKFSLVHSIDGLRLAEAFSARLPRGSQEILLEVNTSRESSKSGVTPEEAVSIAEQIARLPGLKLKGLMTVGPLTEDSLKQRDAFKKLRGLFETIRGKSGGGSDLSTLSMGMSGDFETAIEEGSTLVRVGTALFGSRS